MLDCIYDSTLLGYEKASISHTQKEEIQDPLKEIKLGDKKCKRPTYISKNLLSGFPKELINLLIECKDCFALNCSEITCVIENW